MVPFMFALLLLEHVARRLIFWFLPLARTEASPGFFVNLAMLGLMIVGLILSLRNTNALQSRN
jgi:tellurite resistance protein TehA-like permease